MTLAQRIRCILEGRVEFARGGGGARSAKGKAGGKSSKKAKGVTQASHGGACCKGEGGKFAMGNNYGSLAGKGNSQRAAATRVKDRLEVKIGDRIERSRDPETLFRVMGVMGGPSEFARGRSERQEKPMSRTTVRTPTIEFTRRGAAPAQADGDVVRRRGVIFRSGDYSATHDFTMSPAELKALAGSFSGPIKLDHGHPTTDGPIEFGTLESVEASDDGTTLYGTTATPAWLDKALGDARWLVSASFDRATKAIRRLSLVTRPQISDAELQAAFACACGNDPVTKEEPPMADTNDRLARCRALVEEMTDADLANMLVDAEPNNDPEPEPKDQTDTSDFSEAASMRSEIEALKAERRMERSVAFAAKMKTDERIAPFEEETTAAVMFAAMSDDADTGATVNFSVSKKVCVGTREAMVRAAYSQRLPHGKTKEDIASFSRGHVLSNGDEPQEEDEAAKRKRIDARLANTSTGRGILARRNGNARP